MKIIFAYFLVLSAWAVAQQLPNSQPLKGDQVLPSLDKDSGLKEQLPDEDQVLPHLEVKDPMLKAQIIKASAAMKQLLAPKKEEPVKPKEDAAYEEVSHEPEDMSQEAETELPRVLPKQILKTRSYSYAKEPPSPEPPADLGHKVFQRNLRYAQFTTKQDTVSLPSGSSAVATLLGGVEIATDPTKIEARIDYAFLGPNQSVVGLKDCYVWLTLQANYTTERLYGTPTSISCRAPNRIPFEVPLTGHIKDGKDEYQGIKGTLLANGKAAAAALGFAQGAVGAFGKAMAAAQVQTDVAASDGTTVKGTNVKGDTKKYIVGETLAGASANFMDWWINFYTSLAPTVAAPPGSKIFVTIDGGVEIPRMFFDEKRINTEQTLKTQKEMP